MKYVGVVRKVDDLGRIVVPKELRRNLDINIKDPIEIFVEKDKIILKKYTAKQACMVTGYVSDDNLVLLDGKITLSHEAAKNLASEIERLTAKSS